MSKEKLVVTLVLLGMLMAALWWYFSADFEQHLVPRPASPQLTTERYFLAGEWLQRQGLLVRNQNRLDQLDIHEARNQTLIAHGSLEHYESLTAERLLAWVMAGGHLVISAPRDSTRRSDKHPLNPNGLTSTWRLQSARSRTDDKSSEPKTVEALALGNRHLVLPNRETVLIWGGSQLSGEFSGDLEIWRDESDEVLVVRYAVGAGQVSLLADSGWLANRMMIYPGHVRLLERLTLEPRRHTLLLEQRREQTSLVHWLWNQARWLWLLSMAMVAFWIWSRFPRLGPVRDLTETHPRQMHQQLLATARFDWRHQHGEGLLAAMTEEARQRLQRRYPDWHRLDPATRVERLSKRFPQFGRDSLAFWLTPPTRPHTDDFVQYVQLHRQLMQLL